MTQYQDEQGIWHSRDTLGNPVYWDATTGQWVQEVYHTAYYPPVQKPWYRRTGPLIGVGAAGLFFALVVGVAIGGGAQEVTSGPTSAAAPAPVEPAPVQPAPVEPVPVAPDPAEVRAECVAPALGPFQEALEESGSIGDYVRTDDSASLRSAAGTFSRAADALREGAAGCQDPQVARALNTGARAMDALSSSCRNAAIGLENQDAGALARSLADAKRGSALLTEANDQLTAAGVGS